MNFNLVISGVERTVSSEFSEVFATLEVSSGMLLIRSWYDQPPYNELRWGVKFLILNTEEDLEVYPGQGSTGFWQSIGFTLADKSTNKWQYRR